MKMKDIVKLVGQNVIVTCTDGEAVRGMFSTYMAHWQDIDSPEEIYVREGSLADGLLTIPADEIASIEAA